jgi:peroxiredoxin Q/BCP
MIRVLLLLLLASASAMAQSRIPAVGERAPRFSLTSSQDSTIALENYRGRWLVLYFYPRSFTGGCTLEAHNFERDITRFRSYGARVIGVSLDSATTHKAFCDSLRLSFPLLSDLDGSVSAAYGSLVQRGDMRVAARNTFIIDPDGFIAAVFTGVQPADHSQEVLDELTRLGKTR